MALILSCATVTGRADEVLVDSQRHSLRRIQPQEFEMGAQDSTPFNKDHSTYNLQDDRPIHAVILTTPFYLASHEVTRGQFAAFVDDTDYETTAERQSRGIVGWDPKDDAARDEIVRSFRSVSTFTWRDPGFDQTDDHPVVGVSYKDALAYCRWLSKRENATYRLPTEAEWECACRAGTTTAFSFGDDYRDIIHRQANLGNVELERAFRHRVNRQWLVDVRKQIDDGAIFTAPVGGYPANAWGIHDMHGNVWEWCRDRYLDTYYEQFKREQHNAIRPRAIDPVCDEEWIEEGEWRVIRGGSWFNSPVQCRSGTRGFFEAEDAACYVGFRVVREVSSDEQLQARLRHLASEDALAKLITAAARASEPVGRDIRLELACDDINEQTFEDIFQIQRPIDLELRPPGKLTRATIAAVCRAPNLTGVTFRAGGDDLDSSSFAPLAEHPELEHLQITGIGELDDSVVDFFREADRLRSLHLQGRSITDAGLFRLPAFEALRTLRLSQTQVGGTSLARFLGSPLEQVSFDHLNDEGAALLGNFETLLSVQLNGCPLTDVAIERLATLRRLRDLQLHDMSNLTDDALISIGNLRQLERLDLRGTGAGDQTMAAIASLVRLTRLQLDSETLTDEGAGRVAGLVSLRDVYIGPNCRISDAGLSSFWRMVNLSAIQIRNDGVRGDAFRTLAELPRLRRMEIVSANLRGESLSWIAGSPSLEEISIGTWDHAPSRDLDIASIAKLAAAKSLKRVTLVGYRDVITDDEMERLSKSFANIQWSLR
ncbi:MAG: SUMF1/EgtB/PvdO family nonheme iron enzyme [Planctomycetota bacterium]